MICTGIPTVPNPMVAYLEFYQQWYKLNCDIFRIWGLPMMNIYFGDIDDLQGTTKSTEND
jgi:hypothetical protein